MILIFSEDVIGSRDNLVVMIIILIHGNKSICRIMLKIEATGEGGYYYEYY